MLDRLRRRTVLAESDFAGCRRVEAYVDGAEFTIGDNSSTVLLALGDAKPVELTADAADALAAALALRAGKLRLNAAPDPAA